MIAHTQPHAIYEEMAKEAKASRESAKPEQKSAKRRLRKPPRGASTKSKKNEIAALKKLYNSIKEGRE
jgi:hypothetical protein